MNALDLIAGFGFGMAAALAACGALAWWFGGDE